MRSYGLALVCTLAACRSLLGYEDPTIADANTGANVGFEVAQSGADEFLDTPLLIPIALSEAVASPVTVTIQVAPGGTAMAGTDFTLVENTVTFAPGETRKEIAVAIAMDLDETEANEQFDLVIGTVTGDAVIGANARHSVTIANVLLPRVTMAASASSNPEDAGTLTINLSAVADGDSTVTLKVMPNTATFADLSLADGTVVTIPAGMASATVNLGIIEDGLDEDDETVTFELIGTSANLVIGTLKTTTHTILDNDTPPVIRFSIAASAVAETGATAQLAVELSAASGRTVTVDFARDAADSSDDMDATVVGGTLTFLAGETSHAITVTLTDDTLDEDDETCIVTLVNPVNASVAANATHTLTISDNDPAPAVAFETATSTVDEDAAGATNLIVRLSVVSGRTVTVPFSINASSTATQGVDFSLMTSSPLTFAPGQTSRTISLDVPDSAPQNEPNETAILNLGTPTNATLGSPATHTLTITE
jgi:hypothetical protein